MSNRRRGGHQWQMGVKARTVAVGCPSLMPGMTDDKGPTGTIAGGSAGVFEWLARFNKATATSFEDEAEQRVLWDLEALLVEPFDRNFRK